MSRARGEGCSCGRAAPARSCCLCGPAVLLALWALLAAGCSRSSGSGEPAPSNPPAISAVNPLAGEPGTPVAIAGRDFETRPQRNLVFFGTVQAPVREATAERLVVEVPAGVRADAQVQLSVTTRGGTAEGPLFTAHAPAGAPEITEIRTEAGERTIVAFPGQRLVLAGSGFAAVPEQNEVTIGLVPVNVLAATAGALTVELPAAAESGAVAVRAAGVPSVATAGEPPTLFVAGGAASSFDRGGVGKAGAELLGAWPRTHLLVEIDVQQDGSSADWSPSAEALAKLGTRLGERLFKPGGITILQPSTFAASDRSWTEDEVRATAFAQRNLHSRGNTAVLHLLVLAGEFAPNEAVIGLTFASTHIALFEERLRDASSPLTLETAEAATLVHEAGHVLGLVNLTAGMCVPHEDPDSRGHDIERDCVMHREISVRRVPLGGGPTDAFDPNCRCDLAQAGGRP
ncbi:MAG: hypothetical protein KatS3mg102_2735 [Planctomycetota bacterium]|nr:MAG: hypothetical protein KatS3mg102_2735 [Planctomycetota bacterium]